MGIAAADVRWRRIPNVALVVIAAPAVTAYFTTGTGLLGTGPVHAVLGLLLAIALLLPGYALRQVGAGDVKYSALLGFLLGPAQALSLLAVAGILLGGVSTAALVERRYLHPAVRRVPAGACLSMAFAIELFGQDFLPGVLHA